MNDDKERSHLPASGFTDTNTSLHKWAGTVVAAARELFSGQPIQAAIWPYREQGSMMLSCDLLNEDGSVLLPITIQAVEQYWLPDVDGSAIEANVPDMAEAVHLAGIITQALGAKVTIGRGQNEVNAAVLAAPLSSTQTNGKLFLWN